MTDRRPSMVEHRSTVGSWRFISRDPHPWLRPYVIGISAFEGVDRPTGLGLGSPSAELVISLGGWSEWLPRGRSKGEFRTGEPFISGLREVSKTYRLEKGYSGILVDLTALGARRVLGTPMSDLANREVEAREVLGAGITDLQGRLVAARGWAERFDELERYVGSRIEASSPCPGEVRVAWESIAASRGRVRIDALSRAAALGSRRMRDLFKVEFGLSPKRLVDLVRFDHAIALATREPDLSWSAVAYRAGYYDQAHLINDVRARTGLAPTACRQELAPERWMAGPDRPPGALSGVVA